MKRILVALNSQTTFAYSFDICRILKDNGNDFRVAISVTEVLSFLKKEEFQLIILDPILPLGQESPQKYREYCPGMDLLDEILQTNPATQFVIMSVYLNDYNILKELKTKRGIIAQISPAEEHGKDELWLVITY